MFNLDQYKRVDKLWGVEYWLVNFPEYCCKLLHINSGWQCSLHAHKAKKESFFIISNSINLERIELDGSTNTIRLYEGDCTHLDPGVFHRFSSLTDEPAVILEISSTHSDEDVIRLEESRPL